MDAEESKPMIVVLILVLLLCFGGGFWGQGQWGPVAGWSPFGVVLLVLVVLYLTGHLPR